LQYEIEWVSLGDQNNLLKIKELKAYSLAEPAVYAEKGGYVGLFTRRVCGFAGMNQSLISGKDKFLLCTLRVLERP
jgi:hypothetical protein